MNIFEIETKITELDQSIAKAKHLVENLIENYDLDSTADMSEQEMKLFAIRREDMFLEASMIHDYLYSAQNSAKVLKEGALV